MAVAQLIYSFYNKYLDGRWLIKGFARPHAATQFQIVKLGLPICLATFFEVTLFACIPLFIADLGAIAVSGHQIAASVTTILFMLPLSLSMAIAIRIGTLSGEGHYSRLVNSVFTSFVCAVVVSIIVATFTFVIRNEIAWVYTQNTEVAVLASGIIVLACIYQLPDALQVAANGVLRGLKYTSPITIVTFVSYWLIGFSLGFVLAKTDLLVPAMGARGFWVGIIVGLTCAAILLLYFVRKRLDTLRPGPV